MQKLSKSELNSFAKAEAAQINRVLASSKAGDARVRRVYPSVYDVIEYEIQRAPGTSIKKVQGVEDEATEAVTSFRVRNGLFDQSAQTIPYVPCLLEKNPARFVVPTPSPQPISWRNVPMANARAFTAFVGVSTLAGRTSLQAVDVSNHDSPHTFIAGMTGSGKSVMQSMMTLSLAASTPPSMLRMFLSDPKNAEIAAMASLPHVEQVAIDEDETMRMLSYIKNEIDNRKRDLKESDPYILLCMDELAQIRLYSKTNTTEAVDILEEFTEVGRGLRMISIMGTQHPSREKLGGMASMNFSRRIVGAVANASAAQYISTHSETNAHRQGSAGQFVMAHRNGFRSVRGFFIDTKKEMRDVLDLVYRCHRQSNRAQPAAKTRVAASPSQSRSVPTDWGGGEEKKPPQFELPDGLAEVFDQYFENLGSNEIAPQDGLIRASMMVLFGKEISGGRRKELVRDIQRYARQYSNERGLIMVPRESGPKRLVTVSEQFAEAGAM